MIRSWTNMSILCYVEKSLFRWWIWIIEIWLSYYDSLYSQSSQRAELLSVLIPAEVIRHTTNDQSLANFYVFWIDSIWVLSSQKPYIHLRNSSFLLKFGKALSNLRSSSNLYYLCLLYENMNKIASISIALQKGGYYKSAHSVWLFMDFCYDFPRKRSTSSGRYLSTHS